MRRKDRSISEVEARALLSEGEYGIFSTLSVDGYPYGVPVNFTNTAETIYIHSATEGEKLDNIRFSEWQSQKKIVFTNRGYLYEK